MSSRHARAEQALLEKLEALRKAKVEGGALALSSGGPAASSGLASLDALAQGRLAAPPSGAGSGSGQELGPRGPAKPGEGEGLS